MLNIQQRRIHGFVILQFFVLVWLKSLPQENHLLNTEFALCPWIHEILLIFTLWAHPPSKTVSSTPHQTFQKAYRSSQASRRHYYVFLVVLIILPLPSRLFPRVAHLTLQLRFISSTFRYLIYVKSMEKDKPLLWAIGGWVGWVLPRGAHPFPLFEERCYKDCP